MKRKLWIRKWIKLLLSAISFIFIIQTDAVLVSAEEEMAEWTVMFYFCGSDLESQYSYASQNLEDIAECRGFLNLYQMEIEDVYAGEVPEEDKYQPGKVNVVVQTGGCREWHTQNLGMDVQTDVLQRWRFEMQDSLETGSFQLEETLPLASMADPETLTDFIRWSTETYPAKKTALILWDHGGGSKTGLFVDELFEGDVMYLDELESSLKDSGAHMECIIFDACMMANLETACAVRESANWMVASEELVAGQGSAISSWLQQLIFTPEADGKELGRWICDMTQMQYDRDNDELSGDMLTWSLVDLSRTDQVLDVFDRTFARLGEIYRDYPNLMMSIADRIVEAEVYGTGQENLWDLSDVFYKIQEYMSPGLCRDMREALKEALVYSVKGSARGAARGLSFCYAVDFSASELNTYSRNCPSLHYMAFLDAVCPWWDAPEEIYDSVDRLPTIDTLEEYQVKIKKAKRQDGTPGFEVIYNDTISTSVIRYNLLRIQEETGNQYWYGTLPASLDYWNDGEKYVFMYTAFEPWKWPAVEGAHCTLEVYSANRPGWTSYEGSIPIRIGEDNWNLRCGYDSEGDLFTVYGLWAGSDSGGSMFNRNVRSLAQLAGQEYSILHPVYSGDGAKEPYYEVGETSIIYRAMEVVNQTLPAGVYYIRYLVYDLFMRPYPLEWIKMEWDGGQAVFPDADSWEGEVALTIPPEYWE